MSSENKRKKRTPKLCTIQCEWENCKSTVTLLPSEYGTFSDHLKVHADEFVARLKSETENDENKVMSCCCMWRACSWEGCEDLSDLIRHIMSHGYHAMLKALGSLVQAKLNLTDCSIDVDDPYHMLSNIVSPFICCWKECQTEFLCPDKYFRHVESHILQSSGIFDDDDDKVKMQCNWKDCNNQFRDKHKLKEHMRVHTHEKIMACPGCGGLFSNRTKLLDHLSRQNPQAYENFQCSHCLKRCASERLLRDHMRHHVNYLKCPHCDMTCPNPGSLKYHIHYRHSDERPFTCPMCNHSFKSNSDLARHEESHTEKSYICTVEGCTYATKTAHCLRRHVKMTHCDGGAKKYVCHICNHVYSRGFGLTKHLKKQHNFSWPSGHPRFRYIEYDDGFFRLQMVRFESAELTTRLRRDSVPAIEDYSEEVEIEQPSEYHEEENENEYEHDEVEQTEMTEVSNEEALDTSSVEEIKAEMTSESAIETSSAVAVASEEEEDERIVSTQCDIYLQPKPPGFDMTVMSQLIALASKTNPQYNSADTSLVTDMLFQRLIKASKESENESEIETFSENVLPGEVEVAENNEQADFDQVACKLLENDENEKLVALTSEQLVKHFSNMTNQSLTAHGTDSSQTIIDATKTVDTDVNSETENGSREITVHINHINGDDENQVQYALIDLGENQVLQSLDGDQVTGSLVVLKEIVESPAEEPVQPSAKRKCEDIEAIDSLKRLKQESVQASSCEMGERLDASQVLLSLQSNS